MMSTLKIEQIYEKIHLIESIVEKCTNNPQNSTNGTSENDDPNMKHNDMYYIGALIGLCAAIAGGLLNITVNFCKEIHSFVLLWWSGIGHSV